MSDAPKDAFSAIKETKAPLHAQATEPAYTEHDLREAQKLHKLWNEEACGFFDGGNMCLDCEVIASELSLIRSEARAGMREACANAVSPAFRNATGTFTCEDCGVTGTVPSLIRHDKYCGQTVIRNLPDLAADEAIERIKREARLPYEQIFKWLLGENGEFKARPEGAGAYWWRTELRQRIAALSGKETEHD